MDSYQIIKRPLHSEKAVEDRNRRNAYHFEVDTKANKIEIKNAIEKLFNVKVLNVRTMIVNGKKRRSRNKIGRTPDWKKSIVTLQEGNTIDLGY
ncbi:MAG TPA: 50S ribosomal protein L23 [Candidatus Brocadiales bacterium]|nr:50S ribosomal protein L23 [Candidatus Brocadiales bacterium]